jgi:predicted membrane protein
MGDAGVDMTSAALERLGTVGVLVVASYYMIKYFMGQMARKDERIDKITDLFVAAFREQTVTSERFIAAIDKLAVAVDDLHERRQGPQR